MGARSSLLVALAAAAICVAIALARSLSSPGAHEVPGVARRVHELTGREFDDAAYHAAHPIEPAKK